MSKIEHQHQVALVGYLATLEHQKKIITYFAIPNGGSRNVLEAANLKREGVRAGVSDVCVITKDKVLFVEMKQPMKKLKSGKLSKAGISVQPSQVKFIENVTMNTNIKAKICYGSKEAIEFVKEEI